METRIESHASALTAEKIVAIELSTIESRIRMKLLPESDDIHIVVAMMADTIVRKSWTAGITQAGHIDN